MPAPHRPRHPADDDARHLLAAIDLSRFCPPSPSAFSVGALVVASDGRILATGHSRETGPTAHAEQVALERLSRLSGFAPGPHRTDSPETAGLTLYSSLEPCSTRSSFPQSCTELIIEAGIPRVVFAWREPTTFVTCEGARILGEAGIEVLELDRYAHEVREVNAHLFGPT
ncbi:MAG: diaminohydroxyphosphoribosylaminopyrimidine deaminase [Actinomycetota bacterium]|nr:diaminohydroxyphosphoribosylaminopyrimidine deaminase [Actinomycetota bacterium]